MSLVKLGLSSSRKAVYCVQETKVDCVSLSFLKSFVGPHVDKCQYLKSVGASGGLITCWSSREFACKEVVVRLFSLTVKLKHLFSGASFYLSNVYGPPSWDGKEAFCSELEELSGVCRGQWVLCGDFNLTKCLQERKGRCWSRKLMSMFADLLTKLDLIDLPIGNQRFTWSNMQDVPTLAKLDRFLVSTEWDQAFPLSKVVALPRITSDHTPLRLSTGGNLPPRRFRFEDAWLLREDFNSRMAVWWGEIPVHRSSILSFTAKLRHCRARFKKWSAENFYSISRAKKDLSGEVQSLDLLEESGGLAPTQLERRRLLKRQLSDVVAEEEMLWKSRAKQHWLREGDGNTKFFQAVANGRRRTNFIAEVEDDGYRICREEEKRGYFYDKFKEVFAPPGVSLANSGDWSELFASDQMLGEGYLTVPFSKEEIKTTTFQLGGDKAPGPDGFSLRFYQKFWAVIHDDVCRIFDDLYKGNLHTAPIDYSFISLVPKIEGAKAAGDFRPISLLNGIQKIVSKVLANRLGRVLQDIISSS